MGRANNKKRSWRRLDASEIEKLAQMKSAADTALFMMDGAVQRSNNKSLPSKNTLKAAKKILKSSEKAKNVDRQSNGYDLWAETANNAFSKTRPVVLTKTEPLLAGVVTRSLQPAHPGTSYNPLKEDQQKAIEIAYEIRMKQNKAEMIWNEKMENAKTAVFGTEENDEEGDEVGEESIIIKAPIRPEDRLTKATRNRRRRHKMHMAEAAARKRHRLVLRQIDTIQNLTIVKPGAKKLTKTTRSIQLGKYKVKPEIPAVLPSEEITSNLRDVAFQPTILRDTFLNFQRKGLIEARQKVKVKPTPVRVKLYNRYKDCD